MQISAYGWGTPNQAASIDSSKSGDSITVKLICFYKISLKLSKNFKIFLKIFQIFKKIFKFFKFFSKHNNNNF